MNDENRILTVPEVATLLRIGKSKAYELVKQPDFPVIRIGKTLRILKPQLEIWMQNQSVI